MLQINKTYILEVLKLRVMIGFRKVYGTIATIMVTLILIASITYVRSLSSLTLTDSRYKERKESVLSVIGKIWCAQNQYIKV
jgi:hypothetical protein